MALKNRNDRTLAEKAALYGVLTALAMILSYIEMLIPISIGVPGVKPGLANLVVFTALYMMKPIDAFVISIVRVILVGFTFGNLSAMLYSLAGAVLSFFMMWLCRKKNWLSRTGVSVVGGVSHNTGQLLVASVVLENAAVFVYLPALLLAGMIMGALLGILGSLIMERLPK
ncbi:MAG: Gx transporter family protein [Eubacteriales bacterium]|nr:Gx transporter family protein [Eubacteriales bacterium]